MGDLDAPLVSPPPSSECQLSQGPVWHLYDAGLLPSLPSSAGDAMTRTTRRCLGWGLLLMPIVLVLLALWGYSDTTGPLFGDLCVGLVIWLLLSAWLLR